MRLDLRFPPALLRSPAVRRAVEREAQAIARLAGPGMALDAQSGPRRARASVRTATTRAVRGQAKDARLTRAFTQRRRG